MYSSFPLNTILVFFLGSFFVSVAAAPPAPPKSLIGDGYDCILAHINPSRLQAAIAAAKVTLNPNSKSQYMYNGSPFTKPYLLWPVTPDENTQGRAIDGPYRAVLDDQFNVFSVVMVTEAGVVECRMREDLKSTKTRADMISSDDRISLSMLENAKQEACGKIRKASKERFPVRYDGVLFELNGLQRYMYPILLSGKVWKNSEAKLGKHFMIMNSDCAILGAVSYKHQPEVAHVTFRYQVY